MKEIEIERTFLAKYLPEDLENFESMEIYDKYFPANAHHPNLRLRRKEGKFEITKKQHVQEGDASVQSEHTIELTKEEFENLDSAPGKTLRKKRYFYKSKDGIECEIDVFCDKLEGLALVEIEFKNNEDKENAILPDFILADVTNDDWVAGGMLAGKSCKDIEKFLVEKGYKKMI